MKRVVVLFLAATAVLAACSVAHAEMTAVNNSADAGLSPRVRGALYANNFGGYPASYGPKYGIDVGGGGDKTADDVTYAVIRWDLSALAGQTALDDGTITIARGTYRNPKNFLNHTVDLYAMPLSNADWEEGTGFNQAVTGCAWNRKQGDYSLTPPAEDLWLGENNLATDGISKIGSYTYIGVNENIVYTVPQAAINQWIADGVASVFLRSDSWEAPMGTAYWNINTHEAADAGIGGYHVLSFEPVPEPGMLLLILTVISLGAYFHIRLGQT